jgi:hypothetical protein
VIASNITAERKYGQTQVPIFMLAKDGKILADDSAPVRFGKTGEQIDSTLARPGRLPARYHKLVRCVAWGETRTATVRARLGCPGFRLGSR